MAWPTKRRRLRVGIMQLTSSVDVIVGVYLTLILLFSHCLTRSRMASLTPIPSR